MKPSNPTTKLQASILELFTAVKIIATSYETIRPKCKNAYIYSRGVYNSEKFHTLCVKSSKPTTKMQISYSYPFHSYEIFQSPCVKPSDPSTKKWTFNLEPFTVVKIFTSLVQNRQNYVWKIILPIQPSTNQRNHYWGNSHNWNNLRRPCSPTWSFFPYWARSLGAYVGYGTSNPFALYH